MQKKIAIIGIVGVPANYGGFETLVENLIAGEQDFLFSVYCSSYAYTEKLKTYKNAQLHYIPLKANGFQSIPYDCFGIFHAIAQGHKTLLVLGTSGALAIQLVKLFFPKIKIITNIDGLEWKRNKWNKPTQYLLQFFEKLAVKNSTHTICDNQAILDYVQKCYGRTGTLIAYGGDHAVTGDLSRATNENYYLSICRIEPENNIAMILESFAQSQECIHFIGNWDASDYGKKLKIQYTHYKNIKIIDPIYDIEKLFELRLHCKAYIHGHSAGGTNPSLVEMMFFPKHIIAFDCTYNRSTLHNQGAYFKDSSGLLAIIKTHDFKNTTLHQETAQKSYTWENIRKKYYQLLDI